MNILQYKDYKESILQEINTRLQEEFQEGIQRPKLAILAINPDQASEIYLRNKEKSCEKAGFLCEKRVLDTPTAKEVLAQIHQWNADDSITGIILQLPLPSYLNAQEKDFIEAISPEKDVDGFTLRNLGAMMTQSEGILGCTPLGVLEILKEQLGSLEALGGKVVVVVGRGFLVGKPLVNLMMNHQATVISVNSQTLNPETLCKMGDIVIYAADKLDFFGDSYVRSGQLLIDVGVGKSPNTGALCGCLNVESIKSMDVTAVVSPGGVGQLTQAMLMKNLMTLYQNHKTAT